MSQLPNPVAPPPPRQTPSVTVRTVLENDAKAIVEALALVRSLRAFGGRQADAPCEVHFVDSAPQDVSAFERLDAEVRVVERLDRRSPHSNKLQMHYAVETDYLLALDCDVVVAADFTGYLVGESVASAADWGDWMPEPGWSELFAAAGSPLPRERVITPRFWQETIHYANSGVLVVPREHVETLRREWEHWVRTLLDGAAEREWWGEMQTYFTDQIALAMVNHLAPFPTRVLPLEMNWLLKFDDLPEELAAETRRPILMHSIHRMHFESGHLLPHTYPGCQEAIARYNALLPPVDDAALEEALAEFDRADRGW